MIEKKMEQSGKSKFLRENDLYEGYPGLDSEIPEEVINETGTLKTREWNKEYKPGDILERDGTRIKLLSEETSNGFEYEIIAYQKTGKKEWTDADPYQSPSRIKNFTGWRKALS